jgi:hypothetical protein
MDNTTRAPACGLSADSQILTRRGWVAATEATAVDQVATRSGDWFRWERPSGVTVEQHSGAMVLWAGKAVNLFVTPDTPLTVRRPPAYMRLHPDAPGADWHAKPARYFAENPTAQFDLPATSRWAGESPTDFTIERSKADRAHRAWDAATKWLADYLTEDWTPSDQILKAAHDEGISHQALTAARKRLGVKSRRRGDTRSGAGRSWWETGRPTREYTPEAGGYQPVRGLKVPIRAFCSFLGLFIAEGWVRKDRGEILISQKPTSRHMPEIGSILNDVGIRWSYNAQTWKFSLSHTALGVWLTRNAGDCAHRKRVPDGFKEHSPELLQALLRGMMIGDGHWGQNGQRYYTTTSRRLADDVQEIFQKTGADAWIRPQDLSPYTAGAFGTSRRMQFVVRERMQDSHWLPRAEFTENSGKICRLAAHGCVYVRREGRAIWVGA